jgi:N-acetylneuraminic acid mutarotase
MGNSESGILLSNRVPIEWQLGGSSGFQAQQLQLAAREGSCGAAARHGSEFYVFGGGALDANQFNDVLRIDWRQGTVQVLTTTGQRPSARTGASLLSVGDGDDELLLFGGIGAAEGRWFNDVYVLDLNTLQWRQLKCSEIDGEAPTPRDKFCALKLNADQVLCYGGFGPVDARTAMKPASDDDDDENALSDDETATFGWSGEVWVLTASSGVWQLQACGGDVPDGRAGAAAALLGNNTVYVFGGRDSTKRTNAFYALDVDTWSWKAVQARGQYPMARCFHLAAAISPTRLLVYGGRGHTDEQTDLSQVCVYDADANAWFSPVFGGAGSGEPGGRGFSASAVISDAGGGDKRSLLVFGGSSGWSSEAGNVTKLHSELLSLDLASLASEATPPVPEVVANNDNEASSSFQ